MTLKHLISKQGSLVLFKLFLNLKWSMNIPYVIYNSGFRFTILCGTRTSEAQTLCVINTIYTSRVRNLSKRMPKMQNDFKASRHRLRHWAKETSPPWIPSAWQSMPIKSCRAQWVSIRSTCASVLVVDTDSHTTELSRKSPGEQHYLQ